MQGLGFRIIDELVKVQGFRVQIPHSYPLMGAVTYIYIYTNDVGQSLRADYTSWNNNGFHNMEPIFLLAGFFYPGRSLVAFPQESLEGVLSGGQQLLL